eukprot:2312803-Alexandrium_andersonii.AAC.1
MLRPAVAERSLARLISKARACGVLTVSAALDAPRCAGRMGGRAWPRTEQEETLTLREIWGALVYGAKMCAYRL